uniref:(northern house mosquito) hypothetical protein n=1 Tax=Culex pipiens TaxID=7175 RepID=A0A8D8FMS3_CULPI
MKKQRYKDFKNITLLMINLWEKEVTPAFLNLLNVNHLQRDLSLRRGVTLFYFVNFAGTKLHFLNMMYTFLRKERKKLRRFRETGKLQYVTYQRKMRFLCTRLQELFRFLSMSEIFNSSRLCEFLFTINSSMMYMRYTFVLRRFC